MKRLTKVKFTKPVSEQLTRKRNRPALVTTISAPNKDYLVNLKEQTGADVSQILDEILDCARQSEPVKA
jgi:hypothetical protein